MCHNQIDTEYEVLRPHVCQSALCAYQYYMMGWGPSLEYQILHNSLVVDLLVSLTYTSAREHVLEKPLPIGLGLQVPPPDSERLSQIRRSRAAAPQAHPYIANMPGYTAPAAPPENDAPIHINSEGLCEFDKLDIWQMRVVIADLINKLPSINDMKKHLTKKTRSSKAKPTLQTMDPKIPAASWIILRWCVASCTADLQELVEEEDLVQNVDATFRQFRFSVGAPDAEAKFKSAVEEARRTDKNCNNYPILYAFHGSPLKNWHSIIRHGLWFKDIAHGRAYGNGVYFAQDGSVSMGTYAQSSTAIWKNSDIQPTSCTALTEIVNLPAQFVSSNPYLVVQHTNWLLCRYLLVKCAGSVSSTGKQTGTKSSDVPLVRLDPTRKLTIGQSTIKIPDPTYKLETLVRTRMGEHHDEDYDGEDDDVFAGKAWEASQQQASGAHAGKGSQHEPIELDYDYDMAMDTLGSGSGAAGSSSKATSSKAIVRPADDWQHNPDWLAECTQFLMPPPMDSTIGAVGTLQKLLRQMLKEQAQARSYKELGWFLPEEAMGDNLFQWVVELHSFDPALPVAKDMKKQ